MPTIEYGCEHVLGTLLDSSVARYVEYNNVSTASVIAGLLAKQNEAHWTLGDCGYDFNYSYKFENTNLLSALYSVAEPFVQPHLWAFDTTVYPWRLSIAPQETTATITVERSVNMREFKRETDLSQMATRITPLGYGEGVNQLGIEKVNGGSPYIENADAVAQYGVIERQLVDKKIESAATLKSKATALLAKLSAPRYVYTVGAADLQRAIIDPNTRPAPFAVGSAINVIETDTAQKITVNVVAISKGDVDGAPGDITLTLANKGDNIADELSSLMERQLIADLYSQGASNIYTDSLSDNWDADSPATLRIYVPDDAVHVNSVLLNYRTSGFRAYSKATKGGGSTVSTTSSGGGSTQTSSSGGGVSKSTESGGATTQTSSAGGEHSHRMFAYINDVSGYDPSVDWKNYVAKDSGGNATGVFIPAGSSADLYTRDSAGQHTHSVSVPAHSHSFNTPDHTHSVTIPSHTHSISLPDHTHDILYGIFEDSAPTAVTLKIDGTTVSGAGTSDSNLELVPYLSKDADGNVTRGWHDLTFSSNGLGRVEASVVVRVFIQSHTGGQY